MKTYPKAEKEIVCFECRTPIQTRNELLFIYDKSSAYKYKLAPLHTDCYGKLFKTNRKTIQAMDSESLYRNYKSGLWLNRISFFLGVGLLIMAALNQFSLEEPINALLISYGVSILLSVNGEKNPCL